MSSLEVRGLWVPDARWEDTLSMWLVDYSDEQVRPHGTELLPTIWLAATTDAPLDLQADWELTAAPPARGRLRGTLDLTLDDEVVDASALVREVEDEA